MLSFVVDEKSFYNIWNTSKTHDSPCRSMVRFEMCFFHTYNNIIMDGIENIENIDDIVSLLRLVNDDSVSLITV